MKNKQIDYISIIMTKRHNNNVTSENVWEFEF